MRIVLSVFLACAGCAQMFGLQESVDRGASLFQAGKYAEAEAALREAVLQHPEDARAHALMGRVLLEQKRPQEAAVELRRALELNPEEAGARLGLARAHIELREWPQSQTLIEQALQKNPNEAEAYYLRGLLAAASRGDHQAAAADFEKALQIDPNLAYAHYHAGLVYSRLRRPDLMARHFEAFLRLAPNAPEAPKVQQVLSTIR